MRHRSALVVLGFLAAVAVIGAIATFGYQRWQLTYHLKGLESTDPGARREAAEALIEIGDLRALEPLVRADVEGLLASAGSDRQHMVGTLTIRRSSVVTQTVDLPPSDDEPSDLFTVRFVRRRASSKKLLEPIGRLLDVDDAPVRHVVRLAARELRGDAADAVHRKLLSTVDDLESLATNLGHFDPDASLADWIRAAPPEVGGSPSDWQMLVRFHADLRASPGQPPFAGPSAEEVAELIELLSSASPHHRLGAAIAFGLFPSSRAIPALTDAMSTSDRVTRLAIVDALAMTISTPQPSSSATATTSLRTTAFRRALEDSGARVRQRALTAMIHEKSLTHRDAIRLLADNDAVVLGRAIEALAPSTYAERLEAFEALLRFVESGTARSIVDPGLPGPLRSLRWNRSPRQTTSTLADAATRAIAKLELSPEVLIPHAVRVATKNPAATRGCLELALSHGEAAAPYLADLLPLARHLLESNPPSNDDDRGAWLFEAMAGLGSVAAPLVRELLREHGHSVSRLLPSVRLLSQFPHPEDEALVAEAIRRCAPAERFLQFYARDARELARVGGSLADSVADGIAQGMLAKLDRSERPRAQLERLEDDVLALLAAGSPEVPELPFREYVSRAREHRDIVFDARWPLREDDRLREFLAHAKGSPEPSRAAAAPRPAEESSRRVRDLLAGLRKGSRYPGAVAGELDALISVDSSAVSECAEFMRHHRPVLREAAARALGRVGVDASTAVTELESTLDDPDGSVREAAAVSLGRIGPAAAPAVPALVERLSDPLPPVRRAATEALGRIGPAASNAATRLEELRGDPRLGEAVRVALMRIVAVGGER